MTIYGRISWKSFGGPVRRTDGGDQRQCGRGDPGSRQTSNCIEEIYGGLNGILGILNEELIDMNEEKARTIEGLKHTPAAALGTCRYKIDFKKKPEQAAKDMDRLFEVFQAHNIRYFFYAGGNDSQDTSHKIHRGSRQARLGNARHRRAQDHRQRFAAHRPLPGYGSVIKYNADDGHGSRLGRRQHGHR